jgi:hypothetical protein
MASNQVEAYNKARNDRIAAENAGVKGHDLEVLKTAEKARKAEVDSATGSTSGGSWGILS